MPSRWSEVGRYGREGGTLFVYLPTNQASFVRLSVNEEERAPSCDLAGWGTEEQ